MKGNLFIPTVPIYQFHLNWDEITEGWSILSADPINPVPKRLSVFVFSIVIDRISIDCQIELIKTRLRNIQEWLLGLLFFFFFLFYTHSTSILLPEFTDCLLNYDKLKKKRSKKKIQEIPEKYAYKKSNRDSKTKIMWIKNDLFWEKTRSNTVK